MLKAFMPVAVYSLIVSFHTDSFRRASMLNMLGISAGVAVAVAAYGEARFDAFGVMLQLTAVAAEATWLVLIQILVTSNGKSLNPHHLALLYRAVLSRVLDAAMVLRRAADAAAAPLHSTARSLAAALLHWSRARPLPLHSPPSAAACSPASSGRLHRPPAAHLATHSNGSSLTPLSVVEVALPTEQNRR
ncbi:Os03g0301900 [Oryza sativa Japonica Group]|uniref:Os03g0301900 protein n=1 Tax=Oryza sativa subsp. japonica TaxID=39947 RepID=C7J0P1_ORYSJ|nr:Os03g0301900 [Oryza sativa Japonica Group]|eukprot:NP_001173386.1 Os03g0301900 [Oryza sativa Japonica Group]